MGWYPYRPSKVQVLTDDHMSQRKIFSQWLLIKFAENKDFPQDICFSDEKWFVLHQAPNSQNDRFWSIENPHEYSQCKDQGQQKVMCWAGFCGGVFLPLVWFIDENGHPISVNKDNYLKMIRSKVLPVLQRKANFKDVWWMQDGAPSHTAKIVMDFLQEKFEDRIISRKSPTPWPAKSPDMNPLDYWFWGHAQAKVYRQKPQSIQEVQQIVKMVARTCPKEVITKAAMNIIKRASKCLENEGSHFESEL
jgi:inhibitor of nuclear factor kappa-B kinase subunit alpha